MSDYFEKRLPRMDVGADELARSTRGADVLAFQHDPNADAASPTKRDAASRAMLSVRERSSHQLSDCIAAPEGAADAAPRTNEEGRPLTRTAMLAMRREADIAQNAHLDSQMKSTMPIGVTPGAPGRNPDMKKFSADDVHRCIGRPPR